MSNLHSDSVTRLLCPLCDWHHDLRQGLPDLTGITGSSFDDMIRASIVRQNGMVESILQAHLETHSMLEWVKEASRLRSELDKVTEERDRFEEQLYNSNEQRG